MAQMTRLRSSAGQYLSPGPGAPCSASPREERGGTAVSLHLSSPRSGAVVTEQTVCPDLFALLSLAGSYR